MDDLPETLDGTYEQTLRMINKHNRGYACRLFQCLVVSKRPLLATELAELFAIEPNKDTISPYTAQSRPENPEEFILSACSTLVAIVNSSGQKIVQFSHFSVSEYLTSNRISISEHVSRFHVLLRPAHTLLARACLTVLLHLDDDMDRDKIQNFPLASYAAEYWVAHAQVDSVSSDLKHEMERIFDKHEPFFAAWLRLYNIDDPTPSFRSSPHHSQPYPTPLYYAALCGFRDVAEHLINARRQDVNARGGLHLTPLHAALDKGHPSVAVLLLERGAVIESRDSRGWTPLLKASYHGYINVASSLIDLDADLNAEGDSRETPLHVAYQEGHDEIVGLLLDHSADVILPATDGETLLHLASREGRDHVISLLLDHGVDVNSSNGDGWTALHFASWQGYKVLVGSLLDRGADANYPNNLGRTPLHHASLQGHDRVVRSLLDQGVDVNPSDNDGWIPLHLASLQGYNDIVMLLLDHGANANHPSSQRWTSLHLASLEGRNDTVRLLLEHGADPKYRNSQGSTPHHIASQEGHDQIVQLLLDHSVDPKHQNNHGSAESAPSHIPSWGHDHVRVLRNQVQRRITGIVMPGLHCVLHRGRVRTSSSGYYSIRFQSLAQLCA